MGSSRLKIAIPTETSAGPGQGGPRSGSRTRSRSWSRLLTAGAVSPIVVAMKTYPQKVIKPGRLTKLEPGFADKNEYNAMGRWREHHPASLSAMSPWFERKIPKAWPEGKEISL